MEANDKEDNEANLDQDKKINDVGDEKGSYSQAEGETHRSHREGNINSMPETKDKKDDTEKFGTAKTNNQ